MSDWTRELLTERSDIFLKLLDARWPQAAELTKRMAKVLHDHGVASGRLLDLCCGNGQVSVHMAKKGFKAVGVDVSKAR